MKCSKCGKKIKNIYTWNGEIYGIECWKQIALPELEKQKQLKIDQWNEKAAIAVQVAKIKDTSKLSNEFKLKILTDIPKFFEENGFITTKQYNILTDQFNSKDKVILNEMFYEMGMIDYETYLNKMVIHTTGKAHQEALEKQFEYAQKIANQFQSLLDKGYTEEEAEKIIENNKMTA